MKNYYWLLLIVLFFSCNKEESVDYKIFIKGFSKEYVSIGDTIEVYIDWENSEFTENLSVNIQGIKQKHLGFIDKSTLLLEITSQIKDYNCLNIRHPNGAEATRCAFYKKDKPMVKSISSLEGKGGDAITITGIDFLSGDSIAVKINAMHCDIINCNDSIITFKVPNGCGNGKIKVVYWPDYSGCKPDRELDAGVFKYSFTNQPAKYVVKSYRQNGEVYLIERDNLGRVIKRLKKDYKTDLFNEYDVFIYGQDGLIDSVKRFSEYGLRHYLVYERNNDNSIIEISQFGYDGEFRQKQEHHYLNGKISQYNSYLFLDNRVIHMFSNQYNYSKDSLVVKRKNFNRDDGFIESEWEYKYVLDIYNNGFPDLGAPGFIDLYDVGTFPFIAYNYSYSTIEYDNWGRFISWDIIDSYCQKQNSSNQRRYEYE